MKCLCKPESVFRYRSPSVWREWIEISEDFAKLFDMSVSLRVEGVD